MAKKQSKRGIQASDFDNPPAFSTPWYLKMESAHVRMMTAPIEVGSTVYSETEPGSLIYRIVRIHAIHASTATVEPDRDPGTLIEIPLSSINRYSD